MGSSGKPKLAIFVRSGLCNRLRVVLSAVAFCELTGRELLIHWPREDSSEQGGVFDCGLSELYEHPFAEISEAEWGRVGRFVRHNEVGLDTKGDIRMRTIHMFPGKMPPADMPNRDTSHTFLASREHYQKSFKQYWENSFRLKRPLQGMVAHELMRLDCFPIVGVCYRAFWQNTETRTKSPCEWFVERMRRIKAWVPEMLFYLYTDCKIASQKIHAEFPAGVVVEQAKDYVYDHVGIMRACVDMHVLGNCNWILGSYISSFSEFAGWLRGGGYSACYKWPTTKRDHYEDSQTWQSDAAYWCGGIRS